VHDAWRRGLIAGYAPTLADLVMASGTDDGLAEVRGGMMAIARELGRAPIVRMQ
jgi:hypothetical protein